MKQTAYSTGLAKVAVGCSTGAIVVNQSLVLRINICSEISPPSPSPKPLLVILTDDTADNK